MYLITWITTYLPTPELAKAHGSPIYYYIRLQCTWVWETCPRFLHGSYLAGNRTSHLWYASPTPY